MLRLDHAARVAVLEGVLRMIAKEAEKREAITQSPEKERWEWLIDVTTSALGGKA